MYTSELTCSLCSQAHSFASTMLLNLLVKDRDLIGHLRSMKKYFLMEQGCGFVSLYCKLVQMIPLLSNSPFWTFWCLF